MNKGKVLSIFSAEIRQTRKTVFDHIRVKIKLSIMSFHKKRRAVKNTTHSAVFLTHSEVFGNVVKHCFECLIHLLSGN